MEGINEGASVGLVLLLSTGAATLLTADVQTIVVLGLAFTAGFSLGRFYPIHRGSERREESRE